MCNLLILVLSINQVFISNILVIVVIKLVQRKTNKDLNTQKF